MAIFYFLFRRFCLLLLLSSANSLLFSGSAFAWYTQYVGENFDTPEEAASNALSHCYTNNADAICWVSELHPQTFDEWAATYSVCYNNMTTGKGACSLQDMTPAFDSGYPVMGVVYTDEQCESAYGGTSQVAPGADGWLADSYDTGACSLSPVSGTGFCSSSASEPYCVADFTATSNGNMITGDTTGTFSVVPSPDVPAYLTEDASCTSNCVTMNGTTYSVDQTQIDNGSVSIIGGGDSGSGDSGGGTGGDSGSGGDTGAGDGSGSDSGGIDWGDTGGDSPTDSDGDGVSDNGDIVGAINGLKSVMRTGFDGIVEKIDGAIDTLTGDCSSDDCSGDADSAVDGFAAGVDEAIAAEEAKEQEVQEAVDQAMTDVGDGDSSSYTDPIVNELPNVAGGSCTGFDFVAGEASFSVDCTGVNHIKSWLGWFLYFFTAWNIINIFLDNSYKKA